MGGGVGCTLPSQDSKCQDLPKFQFLGGILCQVKTQSTKICLNFNFRGGRGVGGTLCQVKTKSAKICLNFNFRGGGYSLPSQNLKCQDLSKFQFWVGGSVPRLGAPSEFWTKFPTTPASYCITDSLSHTTYVETKWNFVWRKMSLHSMIQKCCLRSNTKFIYWTITCSFKFSPFSSYFLQYKIKVTFLTSNMFHTNIRRFQFWGTEESIDQCVNFKSYFVLVLFLRF